MLDEGTLRGRFPEIPWDQPQRVSVLPVGFSPTLAQMNTPLVAAVTTSRWVCRYCICMLGLRGADLAEDKVPFAFMRREQALDHIEQVHHD